MNVSGITGLLGSKKGVIVIFSTLVLALTDPRVADFLPNLSDTHVICITAIVCTALVMQGSIDIVERLKGVPQEPPAN